MSSTGCAVVLMGEILDLDECRLMRFGWYKLFGEEVDEGLGVGG